MVPADDSSAYHRTCNRKSNGFRDISFPRFLMLSTRRPLSPVETWVRKSLASQSPERC